MDLSSLISCSQLDFMDTQSLNNPSFSINFLHGLLPDQPKFFSPLIKLKFSYTYFFLCHSFQRAFLCPCFNPGPLLWCSIM